MHYSAKQTETLKVLMGCLEDASMSYPAANVTQEQCTSMMALWSEDLVQFDATIVRKAFKRHCLSSPYFPSLANVYTLCRAMQDALQEQRRNDATLALAEPVRTVEEQREINERGMVGMREILGSFEAPWQ